MSTIAGMSTDENDTTPPARSDDTIRAAKRAQQELERARRRVDALIVARDAALDIAMRDGWTSRELAEACGGMKDHNIRQMVSRRRRGVAS